MFSNFFICVLFILFLQFPRHSHWRKIVNLRNRPEFEHSFHEIREVMKNSKASSTIKNYDYYYRKFQNWCNLHNFISLPASTATVAIYLNSLVQRSVSVSVLYSNYYSIKWYHDLNLHSNPCDDKLISVFLEGGKRTLSKPIIKKDPITPDILNKIIDMYGKDHSNLKNVRLCAMLLLGYAGFLRYSEIANLKMENIKFFPSYIVVNIVSGKTDVYRRGNNVVIAKTNGKACPVSWLLRYISLAELRYDSEDFIFRAIRYFKSKNVYKLINVNRSLSYTRARELLINCLTVLGLDSSKFCLHSLRSGGTTAAAANNISDRLIKEHGRWKTDFSKDGYIQDTISNQLSVSANLGI